MSAEIKELPMQKLTLYGVLGATMVPLAQVSLLEPDKREKVIEDLLTILASEDKIILYDTLIFTENYDAFRIL